MRGPSASRASTAVAVIAAIVAVLAVMGFPGLSFGQTASIHGGSPSDVFMLREGRPPDVCTPDGVPADSVKVMPLQVQVEAPSHLLVYFSFEWEGLSGHEGGQVSPELDGTGDGFLWRFPGDETRGLMGETVMSSFPDVDPGTHTVDVFAAVEAIPFGGDRGPLFANLQSCVLTVFVIPVAE
jgi:hypothetical protein